MDFIIPKFNISTQQKIASILSSLDAKIDLNNRINAELESMAKTLYDYWFVQFDFPISKEQAQAMGKPELAGKPYKTSCGKMVYHPQLKREIPEGWELKKLGEVTKTKLGGTPSTTKKEFWENGKYNWLNSGEIANFPIISSQFKITEQAIKNSATSLMPKGTVALSITRHIRATILGIDSCANQSVVGILENDDLKESYIYPAIKNEIPRYLSLRTGAQQPHINKETIDNTLILLPDKSILQVYYDKTSPLYKLIINNSFSNQQLTELRDWVLPMLMNGQVKVEDNEETNLNLAAEPEGEYGR